MQLLDLFDDALLGRPAAPAIEYSREGHVVARATFGELEERSNRVAAALESRGLGPGDRLCVYLANCVEYVDIVLACVKLGVVLVPINVLYREREIAHIVADAEPRLVIAARDATSLFPQGTPLWDVDDVTRSAQANDPAPRTAGRRRLPDDGESPAAIVYTSGTTGRSKGAVLSHNNLLANTVNLLACWRITSADRYLGTLPLFHVHGLGNGLMSWLASGCLLHLADRFDAAHIGRLFEEFGATLFFGVPTMYHRLLELPPEQARRVGAQARLFVCGSAPLPAHVLDAFRELYGHTILERYGMSETLMNLANPYAGERRGGSVGLPFPGVAARIVDATAGDVADGVVGELWVRGPNVFRGYWRQPEATAEAFVDGWFRTGDLAERSADGYYTLRGRRSDLIISGGFNIYPREIEELLLEQPGIREAAVIGVSDERRGEVPIAYVVSDTAIEIEQLERVCRTQLASFKVPRAFVLTDALPRTALGKVQKHLLPPWRQP